MLLALMCSLTNPVSALAESGGCWYVRRNGNDRPGFPEDSELLKSYDCYYLDEECAADANKKVLYLTFDAGYENGNVARILDAKQDSLGAYASVRANQLSKIVSQIDRLCQTGKSQISNGTDEHNEGIFLTAHDTPEAVAAATVRLGYDLSDEDNAKVYSAFKQIAERKENVSFKELDAIVA